MAGAPRWLAFVLSVLLLVTGCGTLEVSISPPEPTATSVPDGTAPWLTAAPTSPGPPSPSVVATPSRPPSTTSTPLPPSLPAPMTLTPPSPAVRVPRAFGFFANRVPTENGDGVALAWHAAGEKATICPLIGGRAVGCRCLFDVPLIGSHVIQPSEIIGAYTGFELVVEAAGIHSVLYAPLTVECPDALADWFFDNAPGICPREAPLASYAAAQRFEHGLMIWIEALDAYYVLADHDDKISGDAQGWSSLTSLHIIRGPLDFKAGASPENRVEETPPPGRFEPVSGFGLVWRGEVAGTEEMRGVLGWAVEPEYGFDTLYQCEISCDSYWDCYLRGPQHQVFHLYWLPHIGHFWEVVQ